MAKALPTHINFMLSRMYGNYLCDSLSVHMKWDPFVYKVKQTQHWLYCDHNTTDLTNNINNDLSTADQWNRTDPDYPRTSTISWQYVNRKLTARLLFTSDIWWLISKQFSLLKHVPHYNTTVMGVWCTQRWSKFLPPFSKNNFPLEPRPRQLSGPILENSQHITFTNIY